MMASEVSTENTGPDPINSDTSDAGQPQPGEEEVNDELGSNIFVRSLAAIEGGNQGILIEASNVDADSLQEILERNLSFELNDENYFVEETGGKLGENFYRQMITAVITAFAFVFTAFAIGNIPPYFFSSGVPPELIKLLCFLSFSASDHQELDLAL